MCYDYKFTYFDSSIKMNRLNATKLLFSVVIILNFSQNHILNASSLPSNKKNIDRVSSIDEIQCRTEHGVGVHTINYLKYTWTINQFSLHETKNDQIYSTIFHSATDDDCVRWQLLFEPCGDDINTISLFCFLRFESKINQITANYSVSILNNTGQEGWSTKEEVREFHRGGNGWGWNGCLRKNVFFRDQLLQNDALILSFKLSYHNPCTTNTTLSHQLPQLTTTAIPQSETSIECDHCENLKLLYESSLFADIVLSVNGKNFSAHKAILASHSDVFEVLIKLAKTKDHDGKILLPITDMDEEVTGELLRYIYTRKCKNLRKLAKELLIAANKYALSQLKKICTKTLRETLSAENAADLLVFADRHGADELKSQVMKFIVDKFSQVVSTVAWKHMTLWNHQLINEVCQVLGSTLSDKSSHDENNLRAVCSF